MSDADLEAKIEVLLSTKFGPCLPVKVINSGGMGVVLEVADDFYTQIGVAMKAGGLPEYRQQKLGITPFTRVLEEPEIRKIDEFVDGLHKEFFALSRSERRAHLERHMELLGISKDEYKKHRFAVKALTMMHPNTVERFKQEAKIMKKFSHENIVKVLDYGFTQNRTPYYKMEYVEAIDLENTALGVDDCVHIIRKSLDGLIYAHERSIYHRDLKPANILVSQDFSVVKLTDWGLAKPVGFLDRDNLTKTTAILGTPWFMDPERASNKPMKGEDWSLADMYCLGATFYNLLTGKKPVKVKPEDMDNVLRLLLSIRDEDPVSVRQFNPDIPIELEDILRMLMAKNPEHRLSRYDTKYAFEEYAEKKKWDVTSSLRDVRKQTRKKGKTSTHVIDLADTWYRIGMSTPVDKENVSARKDAFEQAHLQYQVFLQNNYELSQEEIERTKIKLALSMKHAAREHRRMQELGIVVPKTKRSVRILKKASYFGAASAGIAVLGLLGVDFVKTERLKSNIDGACADIVSALASRNLDSAQRSLDLALDYIEDMPASSERARTVRYLQSEVLDLESRVAAAFCYERAAGAYGAAVEALQNHEFMAARNHLQDALSEADSLSGNDTYSGFLSELQALSGRIDDQDHYRQALRLYSEVEQSMERREYSRAAAVLENIEHLIASIGNINTDSIRADVDRTKSTIANYRIYINMYGAVMQLFREESRSIEPYRQQLQRGEFFNRAGLVGLQSRIENILSTLNDEVTINPEAIGPELDVSKDCVAAFSDGITDLLHDLDEAQIAHVNGILESIVFMRDYTLPGVDQHIADVRSSLLRVDEIIRNISGEAENYSDTVDRLETTRQIFSNLVLERAQFSALGDDLQDRVQMALTYLEFSHLDEAMQSLDNVDGVDAYRAIIDLERQVRDGSLYVVRTPLGLTHPMIDAYSEMLAQYRDTGMYANLVDTLSMLDERTDLDLAHAFDEFSALRELGASLETLEGEELAAARADYDRRLGEFYSYLDGVGAQAQVLFDRDAANRPPLRLVNSLIEAYNAVGLEDRAATIADRYQ